MTVVAGAHDKLRSGIDDGDAVVLLGSAVDAELIAAGRFGLIQQCGVGVDRIDVEAATAHWGVGRHVPALNSPAAAEQALMVPAALRRLPGAATGFGWRSSGEPPRRALTGSTICIVGLSAIGGRAQRLGGIRGRTDQGPSRSGQGATAPGSGDARRRVDRLHKGIAATDIFILAATLEARARPLIDARAIAFMRRGAYLVTVASGAGHERALLAPLDDGRIEAARLDVFAHEPHRRTGPWSATRGSSRHNAALTDRHFEVGGRTSGRGIDMRAACHPRTR